jgi:hypothetical protein
VAPDGPIRLAKGHRGALFSMTHGMYQLVLVVVTKSEVGGVATVVRYAVDDETTVSFEIEPVAGFRPAGANELAGRVREAVAPAVEAGQVVLEQVKGLGLEAVEVSFGLKVSGTANWFVAKASTEGNFAVKLSWKATSTEP